MNIETAINLMIKKDEKGLVFIYDNYAGALLGIIVRIVHSDKLGEEILQQVFMKIWSKIESYDSEKATIFTWMAQIARNTAIDQKRLKKYEHIAKTESLDNQLHGNSVTDDHSFMDVDNLTNSLEEKYKTVLDCIYLKGYTHQEASELLGLPIGTIKTRLRKSINLLRASLKDEKVIFTGALFLLMIILHSIWS